MENHQIKVQLTMEPAFVPVFTRSQDIEFHLKGIERDKWAFERLLLDPRYEEWLRRRAIRRSLHHTTRIEGNTLSEEQVGDVLEGEKIQADIKQVAEIENCNKAYQFVDSISENAEIPIDEHVIRHTNALIVGDDNPMLTPGEYRKGENWVRHYMSGKRIYTPPNQGDVPALMREFSVWLRQSHKDVHPVLVAGIAQLRLVEIHPFWDGNGRTGRALSTLILQRLGCGFNKLLSLERYFSLDLPNYFDAISRAVGDHFEQRRDITSWLEYFTNALGIEISLVSDYLIDFRRIMERWHKTFAEKYEISRHHIDAVAYAFLHGGIRPRDYMRLIKVSHEKARLDLKRLEDVGLLRSAGYGRARRYLFISPTEGE